MDIRIPSQLGDEIWWGGLYDLAGARAMAAAISQRQKFTLIITEDAKSAQQLTRELPFFLSADNQLPILSLPSLETLPYDLFSAHSDIIAARLATLWRLTNIKEGVLIMDLPSALQRLSPVEYVQSQVLLLKKGERISLAKLSKQLQQLGYQAVSQVGEHGEYALRGSLVDIFPSAAKKPLRIDFFDDEIDSIHHFALDSQRSTDAVDALNILPAREFAMTEASISAFRQRYRQQFAGDPQASGIYRDISNGIVPSGIEYYLPLFFDECASIFDYIPANSLIIDASLASFDAFWQNLENRYQQRNANIERPILAPDALFLDQEQFAKKCRRYPVVHLQHFALPENQHPQQQNFISHKAPSVALNARAENPHLLLQHFIDRYDGKILFIAQSIGRQQNLRDLLQRMGIDATLVQDFQSALKSPARHLLGVAGLIHGMYCEDLCIISEAQIYGERAAPAQKSKHHGASKDIANIINSLADLSIGAPVVHESHGIGRYMGLKTLTIGDIEHEFLMLAYADDDKLYVPVSDLQLISRYSGASSEHAPLHKLGSDLWSKHKARAAKEARDVAVELLAINAKRQSQQGFGFALPISEYALFASGFLFAETPDQQQAIDDVLNDMQAPTPMDRVVCGDVGFGKTEVAMRAAFLAAYNHRQVCILAPTTLLAQQHFENFQDRFGNWALKIAQLSRFVGKKQQDATVQALADGSVDIVIGTHTLLQDKIKFKNLGLVIVDEEQRFGVRHKEQLKKLRAAVDILTLTATPIPRTLNMAMAGLRALSIIATAPKLRMAVKTFVSEWDDITIKEACEREFARGGQVYFVHNEISSIERIASELKKLLPRARIAIGHGQLSERELETVMLDFYHQHTDILLCTTIIESGIDVPNANTIIINRADKFGLSQLHQMRGRVGRSHHRAYAYLFSPPSASISTDAQKRLEAIASLEELGAGFTLATHDLEIRGAGELLGAEQSGQIQQVGFNMYNDMLRRAVAALKNGEDFDAALPMDAGVKVDLALPMLLPSDYVFDVHIRLMLYKKIASQQDAAGLKEVRAELIDRFGALPVAADYLLQIAHLKLAAAKLGALSINADSRGGKLSFADQNLIDHGKLIACLQGAPQVFKIDNSSTLKYQKPLPEPQQRIDFIWEIFDNISDSSFFIG